MTTGQSGHHVTCLGRGSSLRWSSGRTLEATLTGGVTTPGLPGYEVELDRLGIEAKHSTPYQPPDLRQGRAPPSDLKKFLAKQAPAASLALPQAQLDAFR